MRFMILVKANQETEAGVMPRRENLEAMGKFNEQLVNASIMEAADGLHPSSKGARVRFSRGTSSVIDGPFAEAKELVAGYWVWNVKSRQEAIDWVRRAPFGEGDVVEIRQIFTADDFGAEFTPELREQEARLGTRMQAGR